MSEHTGPTLDTHGEYIVTDCEVCDFTHINPLPRERDLEIFYRNKFYQQSKPSYIENYFRDLDWWLMHFDWRLCEMERLSPDFAKRMLIDIGTGPGLFLEAARRRNWPAFGLEPSRVACDFARSHFGVNVIHDFLTWTNHHNLPNCECIHMHEVLEHVQNPKEILQICYNLLNWNGILCICVPNDYSPWQALTKSKHFIAPPEHLNYFTPKSLRRLVEASGFTVLRLVGTFPMEMFLLMGDDYTENDIIGRQCHERRMAFERKFHEQGRFDELMQLYEGFISQGIGREFVLFATKR